MRAVLQLLADVSGRNVVVSDTVQGNVTLRLKLEAGYVPDWAGLAALVDTLAFMSGYEWIRRVRRTIPAGNLKTGFGDWSIWVAQGLVLVYALLSLAKLSRLSFDAKWRSSTIQTSSPRFR